MQQKQKQNIYIYIHILQLIKNMFKQIKTLQQSYVSSLSS